MSLHTNARDVRSGRRTPSANTGLASRQPRPKASRLCDDDGEMSSAESKGRGNLHQRRARGRRPMPNRQFAWLYLTAVTTLQTATAGAEYGSPARSMILQSSHAQASHLSHLTFLPAPFAHCRTMRPSGCAAKARQKRKRKKQETRRT